MNLDDFGFQVEQHSDGSEAVQIHNPDIHDLVLPELRMPGNNGLEILDKLKEQHPSCPWARIQAGETRYRF